LSIISLAIAKGVHHFKLAQPLLAFDQSHHMSFHLSKSFLNLIEVTYIN